MRLALVQHYADREGVSYAQAEETLLEEAASYEPHEAEDFLTEVGFEPDYMFDAVHLIQRAQDC